MKYRSAGGNSDELSILGFGCMRFPEKNTEIDDKLSRPMLLYAIENGVNYLDTAYIYHRGKSEGYVGRVLKEEGLRDRVKVATKLPPFLIRSAADIPKIFATQQKRLQSERIDYYLIHAIGGVESWQRLCSMGIEDFIAKKKASGEIGRIGFSFHGGRTQFLKLLDVFPWEFCQIQYNFIDENNQAGKSGMLAAAERGLPVFAMEPLRGGKIVNGLPIEVANMWKQTGRSAVELALRWIYNQPEITLALSGMTTMEQVRENVRIASVSEPYCLSEAELEMFKKAREIIMAKTKVPCTGCGYCMPCPFGVDIPTCFGEYNNAFALGAKKYKYLQATGLFSRHPADASRCKKCGKCEEHCPQSIEIRRELENVDKYMRHFPYNAILAMIKKFT